jgi:hypothetical protein
MFDVIEEGRVVESLEQIAARPTEEVDIGSYGKRQ